MFAKLSDKLRHFLFGLPARFFIETFAWFVFPYAILHYGLRDYGVYERMADAYVAPGLLAWLPFGPTPIVIGFLKGALVVGAIGALMGFGYRFFATAAFVAALGLDVLGNGLGFINVEIHLVWYLFAMSLVILSGHAGDGLSPIRARVLPFASWNL